MCFAPQRRALFDISTSKSGPNMVCFVHFDFEMCFAPQRCALFRHLNFQMWSENGVFCTFWLRNVLRATTACNLSSLIWPDGSAPAALASLLFDPPEPQIIGKTQCCFATFLPFRAAGPSFFWGFLFFDLLSPSPPLLFSSLLCSALLFSSLTPVSAFYLLILSELWHLNFLRLFHRYLYATNSYYRYVPPFTARTARFAGDPKKFPGETLVHDDVTSYGWSRTMPIERDN